MEFSRQEYWSGLPFPSPGDLLNIGIEPKAPAWQADSLLSEPPGKPGKRLSSIFIGDKLCTFNGFISFASSACMYLQKSVVSIALALLALQWQVMVNPTDS